MECICAFLFSGGDSDVYVSDWVNVVAVCHYILKVSGKKKNLCYSRLSSPVGYGPLSDSNAACLTSRPRRPAPVRERQGQRWKETLPVFHPSHQVLDFMYHIWPGRGYMWPTRRVVAKLKVDHCMIDFDADLIFELHLCILLIILMHWRGSCMIYRRRLVAETSDCWLLRSKKKHFFFIMIQILYLKVM